MTPAAVVAPVTRFVVGRTTALPMIVAPLKDIAEVPTPAVDRTTRAPAFGVASPTALVTAFPVTEKLALPIMVTVPVAVVTRFVATSTKAKSVGMTVPTEAVTALPVRITLPLPTGVTLPIAPVTALPDTKTLFKFVCAENVKRRELFQNQLHINVGKVKQN